MFLEEREDMIRKPASLCWALNLSLAVKHLRQRLMAYCPLARNQLVCLIGKPFQLNLWKFDAGTGARSKVNRSVHPFPRRGAIRGQWKICKLAHSAIWKRPRSPEYHILQNTWLTDPQVSQLYLGMGMRKVTGWLGCGQKVQVSCFLTTAICSVFKRGGIPPGHHSSTAPFSSHI
jgi:hypothetical protein